MRFEFRVVVEVERESGKFASRDEVAESLREQLEGAGVDEVSGVGADGDTVYNVTDFSVEEV